MKIAFLIPAIDAMGPNIFTLNLVKSLLAFSDVYCEVFHFDRGSKDIKQLEFPVKVTKLMFKDKYNFAEFDIIHSTMPVPDLYVAKHKLYNEHLCITSMHCFMKDDLYQRKGRIKGWIEVQLWKLALNKFKNIIVSSTFMEDYYCKELSSYHSYSIIPYGIPVLEKQETDVVVINRIKKLHKKYKILCGCGSLIKRKGFHQLIAYLRHNTGAAVVLIGRGNQEDNLRMLAKELGVSDRVLFLGFLKDSYNYYPYIDAYCMCSNSEGFGLAMIEAMQMGTPIICSNLPIYIDYFNKNNVGLFEFNNQYSFNQAADTVLADIDYYSQQSQKLANGIFSLGNMGRKHYDYYKELLKKK